ncbi:serine hydrolase [Pseudomaricurvus alcaniphilus]|uniref:serine hydrolase n=1 Tax=Pseudomaricurvus alcaniphilus TaxID=1166482 RepID=UPI00140E1F4A|nr:serine hydrolase [Pseudomaricurvus alcaniphilus]NHN36476.1 serine hydrolase [Pseudomaricurvus alcaniphilus]
MIVQRVVVTLLLVLLGMVPAWSAKAIALSRLESGGNSLSGLVDSDLQKKLQEAIYKNPQWRRLVNQKRMAVGVMDLNGDQPRFARVNGNQMMYAASLPKIAILLAAYVSIEDGSLEETEEVHADLAAMIRVSSNSAATRMIDRIGMRKIGRILADPKYGFYDKKQGGGLWVGRRYAADSERFGDPLHNISHGASITQVCRFYYLLSLGQLVSPQRSAQMLEELSDPKLHHKFVSELNKLDPEATLYRKSGTWRNYHSDSVMVRSTQWRNYILVAMVESADGEKIIKKILPTVEAVLQ